MPAFAKVFDPTFEDLEDPYRHYDADGEPLEDRLYLPVGFDPGMKKTEVVALHPYPGHDQIVWQRTIPTTGLTEAFWLVEEAQRLSEPFGAVPVFVFEATSIYWRRCAICSCRLVCPRRPCPRSKSSICAARRRARRNRMPSMRSKSPSSSRMGRAMLRASRPSPRPRCGSWVVRTCSFRSSWWPRRIA